MVKSVNSRFKSKDFKQGFVIGCIIGLFATILVFMPIADMLNVLWNQVFGENE